MCCAAFPLGVLCGLHAVLHHAVLCLRLPPSGGVLIAGSLNVPLVWLVASVVAWMFTSASCVAVMEKLPWHDALYFVGSTLTTVGYGDVVVRSSMGEL